MPYLMALIMTSPKFSENPKNEQINPWLEFNPMALNKMMINVWNKCAIDHERRKGQRDKDIANRLTKFEGWKVSMRLYELFLRNTR